MPMDNENSSDGTQSLKMETKSIEIETIVDGSTKIGHEERHGKEQEDIVRGQRNSNRSAAVFVRRKTDHQTLWNPERHTSIMNHMRNDLIKALQHCHNAEQRSVLNQALRPPAYILWYSIIVELKSDLYKVLCEKYPSLQLEVYGSPLIGTAFKDSSLEFYINLTPKSKSENELQILDEVTCLLNDSGRFSNLLMDTASHAPILKCTHLKTAYSCHLNFFNRIGTINSPILAHLMSFDDRIDFLFLIIKAWMKIHHCYGHRRLGNYALMWLLIYYLQICPSPIIPPICAFQANVPEVIVDGFNFVFNYNIQCNTQNKCRIVDLLYGFFCFLERFEFDNYVISPLLGRAFLKRDVAAGNVAEFAHYETSLNLQEWVCIQDPFEHTRTLPIQISRKVFNRFIHKASYAREIIECELNQNAGCTKLFLDLFDETRFHRKADEKQQNIY